MSRNVVLTNDQVQQLPLDILEIEILNDPNIMIVFDLSIRVVFSPRSDASFYTGTKCDQKWARIV